MNMSPTSTENGSL